MWRSISWLAGDQLLELAVEISEVAVDAAAGALGAFLPLHARNSQSCLVVDLNKRSSSCNEALVTLGVESWSHGKTGNWQSWGKVSHGHEVILEIQYTV